MIHTTYFIGPNDNTDVSIVSVSLHDTSIRLGTDLSIQGPTKTIAQLLLKLLICSIQLPLAKIMFPQLRFTKNTTRNPTISECIQARLFNTSLR